MNLVRHAVSVIGISHDFYGELAVRQDRPKR